ncbi:MAG: hypothetical protein RR749_10870 [Comamonas sp.]
MLLQMLAQRQAHTGTHGAKKANKRKLRLGHHPVFPVAHRPAITTDFTMKKAL